MHFWETKCEQRILSHSLSPSHTNTHTPTVSPSLTVTLSFLPNTHTHLHTHTYTHSLTIISISPTLTHTHPRAYIYFPTISLFCFFCSNFSNCFFSGSLFWKRLWQKDQYASLLRLPGLWQGDAKWLLNFICSNIHQHLYIFQRIYDLKKDYTLTVWYGEPR